jgi:hypothetical protein
LGSVISDIPSGGLQIGHQRPCLVNSHAKSVKQISTIRAERSYRLTRRAKHIGGLSEYSLVLGVISIEAFELAIHGDHANAREHQSDEKDSVNERGHHR